MVVSDVERRPAVFTPDNEPYLGLQSVLWFDRIIMWTLESNHRVAAYSHAHTDQMSPLQKAACQMIPQGINIALSIRELVRQGYLFPAMSRAIQAAGRVIRSESDRGVIVFLDERFRWANYARCFPKDLQLTLTRDAAYCVEDFFKTP